MSSQRRIVELALLTVLSALLGYALNPVIVIRGAVPNLGLTAAVTACLYVGADEALPLGLLLGLVQAAFTMRNVGATLVTPAAICWAVGSLESRINRQGLPVAPAIVAVASLAAGCLFYVLAPQPHAAAYFSRTLHQATYNTAAGVPLAYLMARRYRHTTEQR